MEQTNTTAASKKQKATSNKGRRILQSFLVIGMAIAAVILIYPFFMDALNDAQQTAIIGGYEEELLALSDNETAKIKAEAERYNEKIYIQQQQVDFMYQGEEYEDPEYDSILVPMEGSLVMGYIEIPKVGIYLPITHGTRTEDLKYQVGHMRGSSVPIGGPNTHAIIAAHTGLQNADLFTDIVYLEEGDQFYIHVLNEIHVYTVEQIKVVLPEEVVPYLQIEDGCDYITLFTCTPYGINDHRLLIRGERTYPDLFYDAQEGDTETVNNKNITAWIIAIGLALIPLLILIIGLYLVNRKKKQKKNTNQNLSIEQLLAEIDIMDYITIDEPAENPNDQNNETS